MSDLIGLIKEFIRQIWGALLLLLVSYVVLALPVMWLWNFALKPAIDCNEIGYLQALALLPLFHILRKPILAQLS